MKLLLDTHALLWSAIQPETLSAASARLLEDPANELLVSTASAWEIATKVRLGMLPGAEAFESDFLSVIHELAFQLVPISAEVALEAGRLPADHGDPFDRILAAQALSLDIPIVSVDARLDFFGVRRIW